jgi:hypothetical protein
MNEPAQKMDRIVQEGAEQSMTRTSIYAAVRSGLPPPPFSPRVIIIRDCYPENS